jgi:hypothetical protein
MKEVRAQEGGAKLQLNLLLGCCNKGTEPKKAAEIARNVFDLDGVLLYIGSMRQGTGHPAEQLQVFLTGLVNPCTMDFVSGKR